MVAYNDSTVTIPSEDSWVANTDHLAHEIAVGLADLARNDSMVTIPSEYAWVAIIDHLCTNCLRRLAAYLLISCMAKHSKMSPSRMSLNFTTLMPHS